MPPKSHNVEVARLEIAYEWMSIHKFIFFLMSRACNLHGEPMTEARATALFHHQVEHGMMRNGPPLEIAVAVDEPLWMEHNGKGFGKSKASRMREMGPYGNMNKEPSSTTGAQKHERSTNTEPGEAGARPPDLPDPPINSVPDQGNCSFVPLK